MQLWLVRERFKKNLYLVIKGLCGFDRRKMLELVPVTDILHLVGLHHTFSSYSFSAGTHRNVNNSESMERFNIFWPRSSIGDHLKYPFRPADDCCPIPPIPTKCNGKL
jgi:hypothetical protein